jgi:hypothetical protein
MAIPLIMLGPGGDYTTRYFAKGKGLRKQLGDADPVENSASTDADRDAQGHSGYSKKSNPAKQGKKQIKRRRRRIPTPGPVADVAAARKTIVPASDRFEHVSPIISGNYQRPAGRSAKRASASHVELVQTEITEPVTSANTNTGKGACSSDVDLTKYDVVTDEQINKLRRVLEAIPMFTRKQAIQAGVNPSVRQPRNTATPSQTLPLTDEAEDLYNKHTPEPRLKLKDQQLQELELSSDANPIPLLPSTESKNKWQPQLQQTSQQASPEQIQYTESANETATGETADHVPNHATGASVQTMEFEHGHQPHAETNENPQPRARLTPGTRLFADNAGTRRRATSQQGHRLRARRGAHQKRRVDPGCQQGTLFASAS